MNRARLSRKRILHVLFLCVFTHDAFGHVSGALKIDTSKWTTKERIGGVCQLGDGSTMLDCIPEERKNDGDIEFYQLDTLPNPGPVQQPPEEGDGGLAELIGAERQHAQAAAPSRSGSELARIVEEERENAHLKQDFGVYNYTHHQNGATAHGSGLNFYRINFLPGIQRNTVLSMSAFLTYLYGILKLVPESLAILIYEHTDTNFRLVFLNYERVIFMISLKSSV